MLSKRAHAALDVLRDEVEGNPAAASALASVEKSLGGNAAQKDHGPTPGQDSAKRAIAEKLSNTPAGDEGEAPKDADGEKPAVKIEVTPPNDSATAPSNFLEMMKSRRGSARKGK